MNIKSMSEYVLDYINQWMMSYNTMLPPIITNWILTFGFWQDNGKWVDTQFWND